jgi:type IV pilus assembly protein PilA
MKSTFTAKYLNHLNKKNGNKGFTLIELLVVIIIVGVLAAIALPSFLNQIGKARGSEAKSNMGTINRAQQAHRLERRTFAGDIANLDAQITGKFYGYALANASADAANAVATTTQGELKTYSGRVEQAAAAFTQIICESEATVASGGAGAVATATTPPTPADAQGGCAADYVAVE